MDDTRLRAGSARREITPEGPVALISIGTDDRTSEGVRDPLFATALVLDDGTTRVGIVSLDLLLLSRAFAGRVRRGVGDAVDELLVAATHAHTAPFAADQALRLNASVSVEHATGEGTMAAIDRAAEGAIAAVRDAADGLAPATLRSGTATNERTPENRRALAGVRNGHDREGPIDATISVLDVETDAGETVVYSAACHPVCAQWESTLSADWPGRVRERVAEETGAEVLFLNGALGDVNPRDYRHDRRGAAADEYLRAVGDEMAASVLEARSDARDADGLRAAPIVADRCELRLPAKRTPPLAALEAQLDDLEGDVDALEAAGDEVGADYRSGERFRLRELRELAAWEGSSFPAEMRYLAAGGVGLLGTPGEPFAEYGRAFREAADVEVLMPVALADGFVGYLPTLDELENRGYEVVTSKVAPEALVRFREAGRDLVSANRGRP